MQTETMIAEEGIEMDAVSESGSPSSGTSERSSGDSAVTKSVHAAKDELRKKEWQAREARFVIAAAILGCAFAVCAAIFATSNQGDYHSFELEVRLS